jgi:hypothetical protein
MAISRVSLKVEYDFVAEKRIEDPELQLTLQELVQKSGLKKHLRRTIGSDLVLNVFIGWLLPFNIPTELSSIRSYLARSGE